MTGVQTCALPISAEAKKLPKRNKVTRATAKPKPAADDVPALTAALAGLHARWRAGTLNGTPLSADDRERLGRAARVEELAEVLRGLA